MIPIRYCILYLSILCSLQGYSQEVDYKLGEVKVKANLQSYYQDDTRREGLDSLIVGSYSFMSLGEALSTQGGLQVSSYGSRGSLSGVKIRGTGDNHTRFHWNGIPLNSLTTGTMDASLIPAGFMQSISITKGASGVLAGNASFGGAIYLDNKADWSKRIDASINAETGSFGYRAIMPSVLLSSDRIQYRLSFQKIKSDNDFPYKDIFKLGEPIENQINDSLNQWGVMQNLYFRFGRNAQLDFGLWLQDKSKDIPPVMGSYLGPLANQKDKSLKSFVKLTKLYSSSRVLLQFGYLNDSLHYTQRNASNPDELLIDSKIHTKSIFSKAEWRWFIGRAFTIDLGAHSEHPSAIVDSYGAEKRENRYSIISAARFRKKGWIANLGVRKEFNPYNPPKPLVSLGLSWKSNSGQNLFSGNISNKFRIPSFNERYWQPGGNPDLLPESGWGGEFAWKWKKEITDSYTQQFESVLFYQKINDWIQWVPSAGYWNPINQDLMLSRGIEVNGISSFDFGKMETKLIWKYSYTNADRAQKDKPEEFNPVIYVPEHQGLVGFSVKIRKISFAFNYQILGERYTSGDLNPLYVLDPIHLLSANSSYRTKIRNMPIEFYIKVNNLLNNNYQIVRSYASPGISVTAGFKMNFTKLKNTTI